MNTVDCKENVLSLSICIIIMGMFLTNILSGISSIINISLFCKMIIFLTLIICLPFIFKRFRKKLLIYFFSVITLSLVQYIVFEDTNEYFLKTFFTYITTIMPVVACFLSINNYDNLFNHLIKLSFIISVITLIMVIIFGGNLFANRYSMGFANTMIFPTNILIYYFFNIDTKKINKIMTIMFAISNIFIICAFGSRGALVCIASYFIFTLFIKKEKNLKNYIIQTIIVALFWILILFYKDIIKLLIELFSNLGLNSRTLYILLNNVTHDSGRKKIWSSILTNIIDNPFLIRGINADYLLLGTYSHNIILEFLYEFGVLIGIPSIIYIFYNIKKTLSAKESSYTSILQLLLFSFFPLILWSGSIWSNMFFWIWIMIFYREKV